MAGHPLGPATRRRLGEPLPHQLADRPRSSPSASCDFHQEGMSLQGRTRYYPAVGPAIPHRWTNSSRVTHPFATGYCYPVRLACVRHAASVRPEPGSNSPSRSLDSVPPKSSGLRKSKSRLRTEVRSQLAQVLAFCFGEPKRPVRSCALKVIDWVDSSDRFRPDRRPHSPIWHSVFRCQEALAVSRRAAAGT